MFPLQGWRRCAIALAIAVSAIIPARAAGDDVIRMPIFATLGTLPILIAADKGYFAEQHLDVQLKRITGSNSTLLPSLARGDIDVAPAVLTPGFFNQYYQDLGLKIFVAVDTPRRGWNDSLWFMVRQDLWDSKAIRALPDLRGKTFDKGAVGSPLDLMTKEIFIKAGLTSNDITLVTRLSGPLDFYPVLENKGIDAVTVVEPVATLLEQRKLAHRWLSSNDVIPWYQASFLATSTMFARDHHDALVRFTSAYLKACQYVAKANGKWTPELIDELAKWSDIPRDVIAAIPGPAYPGGLATISLDSIDRTQQLWMRDGLVTKAVPVGAIVDTSVENAARKQLGIK